MPLPDTAHWGIIDNQEIDFIDYKSKHHWQGFFDSTFVIYISTCIRFATVG